MNENMNEELQMQKYKIKWTEESERLNALQCTAEKLEAELEN